MVQLYTVREQFEPYYCSIDTSGAYKEIELFEACLDLNVPS